MRRIVLWSLVLAALAAVPVGADPGITVSYESEILRVTLNGSYAGAYYLALRSGEPAGQYNPLFAQPALCTGDCFLRDREALPGATYYYRFELRSADGRNESYGPYSVTVPDRPFGVRVSPNPSSGPTRIELSLPGSRSRDAPIQADARVVDLRGRTVRILHSGPLARGVTSLAWDGRGDGGQPLGAGVYFVRLSTAVGSTIARIVRFR